jgi:predicted CXXCH cytochrome family protein
MKSSRFVLTAGFCALVPIILTSTLTSETRAQQAAAPTQEPAWERIDQSQYVGAQKCAECHKDVYESWKGTLHSKMIQRPIADGPDKTIVADFGQASEFRKFDLKDVKWVIGSRWKQRYIGEVNGQEVVYPAQWSVKDHKWQPYEPKHEWWYPYHEDWKSRSNFQLCAGCHSTGSDAYSQTWAELNISCEACHGPGKAHAEKPTIENVVNPARLDLDRSMEVCLVCHQAGKPAGTEYAWAVGYQPGMELSKFWQPFMPEQGKESNELWPNGSAHKNRVQGNTFKQAVMEHKGIQCSVCHDAHGSRHQSMTVKSAETNALCFTCHGPDKPAGLNYAKLSDHTHHADTSTGSRCIECHMPKTGANAVAFEARNHTFKFISPADTLQYGVPNSCNICHADKSPDWALALVNEWYKTKK